MKKKIIIILIIIIHQLFLFSNPEKLHINKKNDFTIGVEFLISTPQLKFYNLKIEHLESKNIYYDKYPYSKTGYGFDDYEDSEYGWRWTFKRPAALTFNAGILLPITFSHFINDSIALGFTVKIGYLSSLFSLCSNENTVYLHNINFQFLLNNKIKLKSKKRLLLEYGLRFDIELFNFPFIVTTNYKVTNETVNFYLGSIFVNLGPMFNIGFENIFKNFSFNYLFFSGCTFGWQGFDKYNLDTNGLSINVLMGIIIRLNYYKSF